MRFKRHLKIEQNLSSIILIPLITVIFQILLFFILFSSFTIQPGIKVKLPKSATSDIIQEDTLTIFINSENIVYLNQNVVTSKELKRELSKPHNKKRIILIKSDRRASVGRIVDVWDLCRSLGIEKINIATNKEN